MQPLLLAIKQCGISYKENEPLKNHTSFRIGGPIPFLLFPQTEKELLAVLPLLANEGIRPLILGNGSNLLVADKPSIQVAIKMEGFSHIKQINSHCIVAQSGALLSKTAIFAKDLGLSGLEFAHGIPGSVGGGIYMNAGAYEGDMGQVVSGVRYLDENFKIQEISGEQVDFSYRHSRFSGSQDIILSAQMTLSPKNQDEISEHMRFLAERRRSSQPLEFPSAGSAFKRPKEGYAAALIDNCNLKGYAIGGAEVSPKHAGFIINRGGATCDDVLALMEHIQEVVLRETGIQLEPEVKRIG